MKRVYGTLAAIILIIAVLSGCSNIKQSKNVKVVEFWTLQLADFAPYINNIISTYESQHPNVKIKWIDVPFSEGEKRSLAAVMSKSVPDLINMNPSFVTTLASRGALLDLRQYVKQNDYDKYLKESWQASELNNKAYGIPWYITSPITIYNAQILKAAGINPDNPPKTYEELGQYAKIIKEKTEKYAFMPNLTEDGKMIKIFYNYNIPIVNQARTRAEFDTPKAQKILAFWVNLYQKGLIPPESITQGHRASLERFQAGDSAFIFAGANFLKSIKSDAPQVYKYTKVAPQITGDSKKVEFSLMNLAVPIKSKHPKEAVDFGLYLTNPENQLEFCKLAPILPSTIETINSDFFSNSNSSDIMQKARILSAKQLKNAQTPLMALTNQKELFEFMDNGTQEALLGKKSPEKVLSEVQKNWNDILQNNK